MRLNIKTILFSEIIETLESPPHDCLMRVERNDPRRVFLPEAYQSALSNNLRFDTATEIMRRDDLGEIIGASKPQDITPDWTEQEARHEIARSVWCDAARLWNLAQ